MPRLRIRGIPVKAAVGVVDGHGIAIAVCTKHLSRWKNLDFVATAQAQRLRNHRVRGKVIENPSAGAFTSWVADEPTLRSIVGYVFFIGDVHSTEARKSVQNRGGHRSSGDRAFQQLI